MLPAGLPAPLQPFCRSGPRARTTVHPTTPVAHRRSAAALALTRGVRKRYVCPLSSDRVFIRCLCGQPLQPRDGTQDNRQCNDRPVRSIVGEPISPIRDLLNSLSGGWAACLRHDGDALQDDTDGQSESKNPVDRWSVRNHFY
jgi:hypothetical protein